MFFLKIYFWLKDLLNRKAVSREGRKERELFEILTGSGSGSDSDKYV